MTENQSAATTPTTTTEATNAYSAFIPEIWSKKLNTMLEKKLR